MPAQNALFLPGMMCDERLWWKLRALQLPVTFGDLSTAESVPELAWHVLESAPDEFALVGLSMGGIVAFEVWRQAPQRVSHMALIDTNPYADTPERQSLRVQQIDDALSGRLREMAIESLKPVYLAEAHRNDQQLLDLILDMAIALGPDVFRRQSLALKNRCDSRATLETISCPATIICGEEDRLCPVEYHEFMARKIPNSTLEVIENCGHLAALEQPAAVDAALRHLFRL